MTYNDFINLDWHFSGHLAMADEHCLTVCAETNGHIFGTCSHAPTQEYKIEHPRARCYKHYHIDGTVYKSRKKLEEALAKI